MKRNLLSFRKHCIRAGVVPRTYLSATYACRCESSNQIHGTREDICRNATSLIRHLHSPLSSFELVSDHRCHESSTL